MQSIAKILTCILAFFITTHFVASQANAQDEWLFKDNTVHKFNLKLKSSNYIYSAEDAPKGWKCAENGPCQLEKTQTVTCTVLKSLKINDIKISAYACDQNMNASFKEVPIDLTEGLDGYWVQNNKALYHYTNFTNLFKSEKNIIIPNLNFDDNYLVMPNNLKDETESKSCEPDNPDFCTTTSYHLALESWCKTISTTASDDASHTICIHDQVGVWRLEAAFAGGFNIEVTAQRTMK